MNKKIILSIGALATTIAPIAVVVSCSPKDDKNILTISFDKEVKADAKSSEKATIEITNIKANENFVKDSIETLKSMKTEVDAIEKSDPKISDEFNKYKKMFDDIRKNENSIVKRFYIQVSNLLADNKGKVITFKFKTPDDKWVDEEMTDKEGKALDFTTPLTERDAKSYEEDYKDEMSLKDFMAYRITYHPYLVLNDTIEWFFGSEYSKALNEAGESMRTLEGKIN